MTSRTPRSPPTRSPNSDGAPELREVYAGEEDPTPVRNDKLVMFRRIAAIVDHLYDGCEASAPVDCIEICELFADATAEKRARMLSVVRWLAE